MSGPGERVTTVNVLTTEPANADVVVEMVREGVAAILSRRDGFLRNRIYRAVEGDAVLNLTEWASLDDVKANHAANEADPDYVRQMEAVDAIATSAPIVYRRVDGAAADREAILAAERRLIAAVLERDREALSDALAPDFTAIGHAGNIVDRDAYIAIHLADDADFTAFETAEQTLREIGDCVLVTGWTTMTNAASEVAVPPKHYAALWQHEGKAWRCAFWQETPIADDGSLPANTET